MRRTTLTAAAVAALLVPAGPAVSGTATAPETCDGRTPTIVVVDVPDVIAPPTVGTPGDDVILGTARRDTIDGGGGNDTICGLGGADTLTGGDGNDRLFGGLDDVYVPDDGYTGDLLVPGPGDDHVDLGADPASRDICQCDVGIWDQVSYAGAPGPVTVDLSAGVATGEGRDTIAVPPTDLSAGIVGTPYDDVLVGSDAKDLIDAGGGDDTVTGGAASDSLYVDREGRPAANLWPETTPDQPGDDTADGGDGGDGIRGSLGRDRLTGGEGRDHLSSFSATPGSVLVGGDGNDALTGVVGTDLRGADGRDDLVSRLSAASGHTVDGGRGRDDVRLSMPWSQAGRGARLVVDIPRERITIDGRRALRLRSPDSTYLGVPRGRVTFLGGAGADTFRAASRVALRALGRGGADRLFGGLRGDHLDGGAGRDTLDGSRGRDRCLDGERLSSCEVRR